MLIPAIDLKDGRVVQLVQGQHQALAFDDISAWVDRFRGFPLVQVIDLDGALGRGDHAGIVGEICRQLPCRVGGGLRSPDSARRALDAGAREVIVASALYTADGIDLAAAEAFALACGRDRLIAAVDGREGQVVIHGWKTPLAISPPDAVRRLDAVCGGFLYTHVDTEGLMQGTNIAAISAVRHAASRSVTAAGGISSWNEVRALHAIGVDAVVGMAIYTGHMPLHDPSAG